MKHVKLLGLCLIAVFALTAVAASAAQAEGPEWGRCVKLAKDKGKYKDSNCTELEGKTNGKGVFKAKAKGFYEWEGNANTTCYLEPAKKGKYKNSTCTELEGKTKKGVFVPEEKGKYEKVVGGPKFTGKGGKSELWASADICEPETRHPYPCPGEKLIINPNVECAGETASGEATGTNGVTGIHVTFKGCSLFGAAPCHSKGAAAGEIVVNALKGSLGYINKAKHEVGVLLEPATAGGTFAYFQCLYEGEEGEEAGSHITVGVGNSLEGAFYKPEATGGNDGIISPITPVNTMTTALTQEYRVNNLPEGGGSENIPSKFEGGHIELLEMFLATEEGNPPTQYSSMWSSAGEEVTNVNTTEGAVEIKA